MPCYPLTDSKGRRTGTICIRDAPHHLGRGIWMDWHSYLGPTFYSDRDLENPIEDWYQNPRIVAAFEAWQAKNSTK